MVAAVMTELQLIGPAAHRESQYLMPEADAEDRFFAHEFFCILNCIRYGLRISGAVAQDYAVRVHFKHCFSRGLRRDNSNAEPGFDKVSQDIKLDAEIIDNNRDERRV